MQKYASVPAGDHGRGADSGGNAHDPHLAVHLGSLSEIRMTI